MADDHHLTDSKLLNAAIDDNWYPVRAVFRGGAKVTKQFFGTYF
jgi:hypothetical protein